MAESFDPYVQWLGIRDPVRPPNHYRLLGLELFESDANVIANAADRQMAHVRTFQTGPHADRSQQLLNELSASRLCLLQPQRKTAYDAALRSALATRQVAAAPPLVANSGAARPRATTVVATPAAPAPQRELADDLTSFAGQRRTRKSAARKSKKSKGPLVLIATLLLAVFVFSLVAWRFRNGSPDSSTRPAQAKSNSLEQPGQKPPSVVAQPSAQVLETVQAAADDLGQHTEPPAENAPEADDVTADTAAPLSAADPSHEQHSAEPDESIELAAAQAVSPNDVETPQAPPDLVALLTGATLANSTGATQRAEVPNADEVKAASAQIKTIFKQQLEAAKTSETRQELSRLLLAKAAESIDDVVGQYALLAAAEELALKAADATLVLDILEQRAKRFDVDTLQEKCDALIKLSKTPRNPALQEQLSVVCGELANEALAGNRFNLALQMARLAVTLSTKSGNREAGKVATRREKEVRDKQKAFDTALAAAEQLRTAPDDGAANLKVGRYLCVAHHDWQHGLPYLAKGNDAKLQAAAQLDLTNPQEPARQVELADRWWDVAAGNTEIQQRAAHWYRQAMPKLSGLAKTHAENRLATVDTASGSNESAAGNRTLQIALNDKVKIGFRRIAPGKFLMGSPGSEPNREELELQHPVTLTKPFYLGVTEVTQAQWQAVMNSNPSEVKGDNLPVQNVYWDQCVAFCDALNKSPLGAKYRFRLPTEAEWEFACRAGTQSIYYYGNDPAQSAQFSWTAANSENRAHPVGQLKPNAWGLYDMLGNVGEWCQDTLNPYPSGPQTNPLSTKEARSRVHRGGSAWAKPEIGARSAVRFGNPSQESRNYIGLRLALDVAGPGSQAAP